MKSIISSLIIAIAILATAFILKKQTVSFESIINELEQVSSTDTETGENQLKNIFSNIGSSMSEGFMSGMSSSKQKQLEEDLELIEARKNFILNDVQVKKGDHKSRELVIGTITNNNDFPVKNIKLNIMFFDNDGKFKDVVQGFKARVEGILEPNQQLGFSIQRNLGDFKAEEEELAKNQSASVKISIIEFDIIKAAEKK